MLQKIRSYLREARIRLDEGGASSVEYLIVIGLIAFVVYAGYQTLGENISTKVNAAANKVNELQFN